MPRQRHPTLSKLAHKRTGLRRRRAVSRKRLAEAFNLVPEGLDAVRGTGTVRLSCFFCSSRVKKLHTCSKSPVAFAWKYASSVARTSVSSREEDSCVVAVATDLRVALSAPSVKISVAMTPTRPLR